MDTIYSRIKKIGAAFFVIWIMENVVFLRIWPLLLLRLCLMGAAAAIIWKYIICELKKTESITEEYVSERTDLEHLSHALPVTEGYSHLIKYLRSADDKKEMLKYSIEQSKLIALQNQINPHFLYNTLDAIRGDALDANCVEIASITEALASFFHYSISDLDRLATLEQELENVREYFKIQQFRFGENLKLELQCEESLDEICRFCIPRMTLQPLVENAISHGLECKEKKGTIRICLVQSQYELIIKVTDDGIGMEKEEVDRINEVLHRSGTGHLKREGRGGIALTNINIRIKLIFGAEYGITLFSCKNIGTTAQINVPLVERNGLYEEGIAENREWDAFSE
ncbi:MAG: sensor histidine kinase [Ruminococcus sp.]|jgi:two-component system sensor histidine kinase YesM